MKGFVVGFAAAAITASAGAATITYTFSGVTSGSLGADTFDSAAFVVTLVGDTDNINGNVFGNPSIFGLRTTATIQIAGLPLATVSGSEDVGIFANDDVNAVGFWRYEQVDMLDVFGGSLDGYHLATDFGPEAFDQIFTGWGSLSTDQGLLNGSASGPVTFTARLVPAPGAMALLGMGGLMAARRRR